MNRDQLQDLHDYTDEMMEEYAKKSYSKTYIPPYICTKFKFCEQVKAATARVFRVLAKRIKLLCSLCIVLVLLCIEK